MKYRRIKIPSFLAALLIVSCNNSAKEKNHYSKRKSNSIDTSFIVGLKKKKEFYNSEYYISTIARNNEVHSAHIGFAGVKSEVYGAYEGLKNSSKMSELFSLLQHDSAAVRVYAYKAIVERDSSLTESAWKELKGKNDMVLTFSGCLKAMETISRAIRY